MPAIMQDWKVLFWKFITGEDKETDNLTPDIHCCFDFPESEADIRKLEERFSSLYNMPKKTG